jgi:hypothetical protein
MSPVTESRRFVNFITDALIKTELKQKTIRIKFWNTRRIAVLFLKVGDNLF